MPVPLPFVEMYDGCVFEILRNLSLALQVVNGPVAASNWYPTVTCGSSKLVPPSGHLPGNRHERRA
ncbi:unnamed protein product [Schistocephalus solidus]|uniref:Uncharacterized protein n=1 Tax=Schistocephalus solidus TaxID=70667 RepID=A0A3P7D7U0_SCHSO|nr:unnamed protein product [Schistocephalus solidus]